MFIFAVMRHGRRPASLGFTAALFLLAFWFGATKANAQSGTITGVVTDTSGASVPGVTVTVLNEGTGVRRAANTSDSGSFSVPLLTQGKYTVTFRAQGYSEVERKGVQLEQAQVYRLDAQLQVATVSSSVEVVAETPALERERNDITTVLESKSIVDTPLNARNVAAFVNLAPGVKAINGSGQLGLSAYADGRVAIAGGSPSANQWLMDGIADENQTSGGFAFGPIPDAMAEIHVVTHTPSAEYGRLGGGVVAYVSKSGTNEFHSSAWEFAQNAVFNANNFFTKRAGQAIAPYNRNQYGFTFGGPVLHNRLFFFGNWEGFRQSQQTQGLYTVPTDAQKQGDFSKLLNASGQQIAIYNPFVTSGQPRQQFSYNGTVNRIDPSLLNPVAKAIASYYPAPNLPGDPNTGLHNYFSSADTLYRRNNIGLRMDYYLTPTRQIAGRFTSDRTPSLFPQPYGADNIGTPGQSKTTYVRYSTFLSYSDAIKSNLLTEVRVGVNVFGIDRIPYSAGFDATKLGFPASLNSNQHLPVFPYFTFSSNSAIGSIAGDNAGQRGYADELANSWTWVLSKHSIKAGWEGRLYQWNSVQGPGLIQFTFDQNWTKGPSPTVAATNGSDVASFMLGLPASGVVYNYLNYMYSTFYYAGYVQDDWKISRRLTANLGLRWEHELPTTARHNNIANFDPNVATTASGVSLTGGIVFPGVNGLSRGNRNSTYDNWGPRVGLAYSLTPSTVVRAGLGIYYLPTTGNFVRLSDTGFSTTTSMVTTLDGGQSPAGTLSNPFPQGAVPITGSSLGALTGLGTSISASPRSLVSGTSQQWSVNLQQQLKSWTVELDYIGNHGLHLPANYAYHHLDQKYLSMGSQLLQVVPNPYAGIISNGTLSASTATRGTLLNYFPQFTGVTGTTNWAGSNYQAGSIRIQRKYNTGLTLLGSYTWSKYLDNNLGDGSNAFADSGSNGVQNWDLLKGEKAISTSSQPHNLVVMAGYDVPGYKAGSRFVRILSSGWRVNGVFSATSGLVIAVGANAPTYGGSRPNLVGDPRPSHATVSQWLNPAAFQTIPSYTFGNSPRNLPNYFTQPLVNLDSSISRTITFADRVRTEFRMEAFNTFNSTTFGSPGTTVGSTSFGVISSLRTGTSPRVLQFGFKGYF